MNPNPYPPPLVNPALRSEPPVLAALVGEDGGMSIDYVLGPEDVVEFSVHHNIRSEQGVKQLRKRWLITGVAVAVSLALMVFLLSSRGMMLNTIPVVLALAVAGIAYVVLYPWIFERRLRAGSRVFISGGRNLAVFGPRRITLTPQLVMHSSPYTQSATRWIAIERVASQPLAVYLYVSSNSAHIVPRRAFASEDDFQTFVQTANEYYARALAAENPLKL